MKLSILIPAFNERYLVGELVRRVLAAPLPPGMDRELVIVDDGSTDGTGEVLEKLAQENPEIRLFRLPKNRGKGAAVRKAIEEASGEFCLIQDADLEYDPNDYLRVLAPLLSGQADVVYGSRFASGERRRALLFWHSVGNHAVTTACNIAANLNLTDVATCYKAFRTELLKTIPIRTRGFGVDVELTIKAAKRGLRFYEVPISYDGRTYLEGKKTTWFDGVRALAVIARYLIVDDLYDERAGHDILASLSRAHRFNRWMADALRPYVGHRPLEIGAGIGNLTIQFLPREWYVASDLDALHLQVLRSLALRRTGVLVSRLDATQRDDFAAVAGQVDTVICLNVLEHIPDSEGAAKNFFEALTPGGRLIVLVPQGPWLYCPLDRALEHVRRYTREDLAELLTRCGFEVEETFHFNRIGLLGWLLNGKLLSRTRMARYQLKVFDSLVWLWRRIDWALPWHGLSIVAIARKPAAANSHEANADGRGEAGHAASAAHSSSAAA